MTTIVSLDDTVEAGKSFMRQAEAVDRQRAGLDAAAVERALNAAVAAFLATAGLDLEVAIGFGDVYTLMQRSWHNEMAYVRLNGRRVSLLFPDSLLGRENGCFFVGKIWVLLLVIARMRRLDPGVTARFVFEIGDTGYLDQVAFNSNHPDACNILDHQFAETNGHAAYRAFCAAARVPWDEREAKVFWRGSTTGLRLYDPPPEGAPDSLDWLPRLRLCKAARALAACDVGITGVVQVPEAHLAARIRDSGLMRPPVRRAGFMRYRGVFDIDGNGNAWAGLFCSLLEGACVLKQQFQM